MNQTMLYKWPGTHEVHGDFFDYIVVNDSDIEQVLAQGWHLTTPEAKEASKPKPLELDPQPLIEPVVVEIGTAEEGPPTRAEMESKARELGIKFDGRTPDAKLLSQIDAHYTKAD